MSMLHGLQHLPGALSLALGAIVAVIVELACVAVAMRWIRRLGAVRASVMGGAFGTADRPRAISRAVSVIAIAGLLTVPVLTLRSSGQARAHYIEAIHSTAAFQERANAISDGLANAVSAIPLGFGVLFAPSLFFGSLACALIVSAGWKHDVLEYALRSGTAPAEESSWWPALLVASLWAMFGVFALVQGALRYCAELMTSFGQVAQAASPDKGPYLLAAMERARFAFEPWRVFGLSVTALVTVGAAGAILLNRGSRAPGYARWGTNWVGSVSCLIAAGALHGMAAPYERENREPIPLLRNAETLRQTRVRVPRLEGPDVILVAPLLELDSKSVTLDGRPVGPEALATDLAVLRRNWLILHPGQPFCGELAVACETGTPMTRLRPPLDLALRGGYDHFRLIFGQQRALDRPVLGRLERNDYTSALVVGSVASPPLNSGAMTSLDVTSFPLYDDFARAVVVLRKAGREARVQLDRTSAASTP
jgi:hypothetical protein